MDDEAVELMKEHGTFVVPTLVAPRAIYENPDHLPDFMVKKARQVAKAHLTSIRKIVKAGVFPLQWERMPELHITPSAIGSLMN